MKSDTPIMDAARGWNDKRDLLAAIGTLERENARLRELLGKLRQFCVAAGFGTATPTMQAVENILSNAVIPPHVCGMSRAMNGECFICGDIPANASHHLPPDAKR